MSKPEHEEYTRDEIKKEFQLERMILFSDAVFAIVITLMAIDIKLPKESGIQSTGLSIDTLTKLAPTVFAYCISFLFIGSIWYQHLTIFSLLKDYDKGLVVRNLLLLFFIGLFPFCATTITSERGSMLPFYIYSGIIFLCITAQYILFHYILIKRPALRVNVNIEKHLDELHKRKISLILISALFLLVIITYLLIPNTQKPFSFLWIALFPIVYRLMRGKKKVHPHTKK
jgi:uncharacterized membrane protein